MYLLALPRPFSPSHSRTMLTTLREDSALTMPTLAVSEMMDRINKRLEDVKLSVTAADELRGTRITHSVFNRRSSAFIGGL